MATASQLREKNAGAFRAFWNAYPRKTAINDAERAFTAAVEGTNTRPGIDPQTLINAAANYAKSVDPDDIRFVPSPANWLASGRYEDQDLFTDQVAQEREWLRGCWQRADVKAVEKRLGVTYPYKPLPVGMSDVTKIAKWHKDQVRAWIASLEAGL